MVWCCFGGSKWSRRVWSPDGAAHLTEMSTRELSTSSLIPPANPRIQPTSGRRNSNSVAEDPSARVRRALTFPSSDTPPHHSAWTDQSHPQDRLRPHSPVGRHNRPRRRSLSSPSTQIRDTSTNSRQRPRQRPRPQSVPGQREMEHLGGYRRTRSSQGFMSSTHLPAVVGGRLRSAARSVTNLHEMGTQNSSFYDRLSSRLNEVIDEIDHEVFSGGEYVYGKAEAHIFFSL